jgi:hypothetical protein
MLLGPMIKNLILVESRFSIAGDLASSSRIAGKLERLPD